WPCWRQSGCATCASSVFPTRRRSLTPFWSKVLLSVHPGNRFPRERRGGGRQKPPKGGTMERIPVSGPWITQKEIDYVTDAVTNAWYSNANLYNARFEEAFAAYTGRKHAISLPSCTSALHLSLLALGIGPGDEVIVPDCTWIATSAPITYVGATPVFADIDPVTWCLDAASLEEN